MAQDKKILWTAADMPLPGALWSRLEGLGYRVLLADGEENLTERIRKISPGLWVGKVNGEPDMVFSLLQEIRADHPDLPIVLLSAHPCVEEAVRAIKIGAADYLSGHASQERLWAALEGALQYAPPGPGPRPGKFGARPPAEPIAAHRAMLQVLSLAKKIAPSRSTVLIQGESGTGKEVVARYIHAQGNRRRGPFVAVNCAALPENLLESELFGHERGAFTGALSRKKGKFELAHGGTLLLDEISETALSIQAKLLRALQERVVDRIGGEAAVPVDVRVIATTNRNLEEETKAGHFRVDLFYRLNVVPLTVPPLRCRVDDIVPLAECFLRTFGAMNRIRVKKISPAAQERLKALPWPGNVRELENLMERATLLVDAERIEPQDLEMLCALEGRKASPEVEPSRVVPLKEMERKMIFRALDDHSGNRTHAAKILGISVRTLRNKLHEYQAQSGGTGPPA